MIPPIASRFVAGETVATALDHTRQLNDRGVGAILNLLGEHYDEQIPADRDAESYLDLLGDLARTDLRARISVKPSQLGLDVSSDLFHSHLGRLAETADETNCYVWLDMEDHATIDPTIDAVEEFGRAHPDTVGVCLQANMMRTPDDLDRLAAVPVGVRLVKGAYDPPDELGYHGADRVNDAFRDLIGDAFQTFDGTIAVATHDMQMIEYAERQCEAFGRSFEIQMLMGVRSEEQFALATDHEVWQYVPYGTKWFSYFYRRVTERRENLAFALRAIVSG